MLAVNQATVSAVLVGRCTRTGFSPATRSSRALGVALALAAVWLIERLPSGRRRVGDAKSQVDARSYLISSGVPTGSFFQSRIRSPFWIRMQPCDGRPGISPGASVPWMPITPPPGQSLSTE